MSFHFITLLDGAWRGGNKVGFLLHLQQVVSSASVFQEPQTCGCICTEQHCVAGKPSTRLYGSAGEPGHCQPLVCGLKDTVALCIWVRAGCWMLAMVYCSHRYGFGLQQANVAIV